MLRLTALGVVPVAALVAWSLLAEDAPPKTKTAPTAVVTPVRTENDGPRDEPAPPKPAPVKPAVKPATKVIRIVPTVNTALAERQAKLRAEQKAARDAATHEQTGEIVMTGKNGLKLQTFCVTPDGLVVGVVGQARGYSGTGAKSGGEIHVYDGDGKKLREWETDFHAQSVNCSPEGVLVVAGDGKLARFNLDGKLLAQGDAPHLIEIETDRDALRAQAEEQLKEQRENLEATLQTLKEDLEELEKKDADDLTAAEKKRLGQLKTLIPTYERSAKTYETRNVDQTVANLTKRMKLINSVAITEADIFYTCGESKGYGYALWRTSHAFDDAKKIAGGLSGCCGQMDIQCRGDQIFVAENSRHRVATYSRDGKKGKFWGNSARTVAVSDKVEVARNAFASFGGCCNPMNLRFTSGGDILTAESEGHVKQFSPDGTFVRVVGMAEVSGGCKNVALAPSPKGDKIYFYDQQKSRVVILTEKESKNTARAE